MKTMLMIEGREYQLEWSSSGGAVRRCFLAGEEISADVFPLGPSSYSVILDGRQREVHVVKGPQGLEAEYDSHRYPLELVDPRTRAAQRSMGKGRGQLNVKSTMPGKVVRILVNEGDSVEKGQGVAVLEAMKMQNELRAPGKGHVTKVAVSEGDKIEANALLMVIAPVEE